MRVTLQNSAVRQILQFYPNMHHTWIRVYSGKSQILSFSIFKMLIFTFRNSRTVYRVTTPFLFIQVFGGTGLGGCAHASRCSGFPCCKSQAPEHPGSVAAALGSSAQAQQLRHMGLIALLHVRSFQTRDCTCVSCTGRQSLYH